MNTPTVINPLAFLGFKKEAKDSIKRSTVKDPNEVEAIIKKVAQFFKVEIEDLKGLVRTRELVEPRQIIMFILTKHSKLSLKLIGELFNRDHTTALYGRNNVENMLITEKEFRFKFQMCIEEVFNNDYLARTRFIDIVKEAKTKALR